MPGRALRGHAALFYCIPRRTAAPCPGAGAARTLSPFKENSVNKKSLITLVAFAAVSAAALAAEPENIIKYREAVMKSQAGHMGAMAQIVRGKVDYGADMAYHAEALNASMHTVPALFPKDSDFGETRALAAVWEKRADFEAVAKKAAAATDALVKAVKANDKEAVTKAFGAVSDSCKACHKDFRQEDK